MRPIWVIPLLWCLAAEAEAFFCFSFGGGGTQRGGYPPPTFAVPEMMTPRPIYPAAGIFPLQAPIEWGMPTRPEIGPIPPDADPVEYRGWRFRPLK